MMMIENVLLSSDKMAVVGRRPRSDEYHPPTATCINATAAGADADDIRDDDAEMLGNHHHHHHHHHHPSRQPRHYADYVQVGNRTLA